MRLRESFQTTPLHKNLNWHKEPSIWSVNQRQLQIYSDAPTDFWQRTHYGFRFDNGHFLGAEFGGDFSIETSVHCDFRHQYDQAGLMIRVSDQFWIKTAVEYEPDEPNKLGVVVTNNGYSDWSTQDVNDAFTSYKLRIIRKDSDYQVAWHNPLTGAWAQMRLLHLFDRPVVQAGLYCCSPKEAGFSARFDYLHVE
jgi:uncharacterized protein